jgi:ribonuclease T2
MLKQRSRATLAFVLVQASSLGFVLAGGAASNEYPGFDLLLLVRSWPPSFCDQLAAEHRSCSKQPVEAFTIHGVWPEYSNGGWPQYCAENLYESANKTLQTASLQGNWREKRVCEWPSYEGGDSTFWEHEWSKHGTCASPLLGNRTSYFQNVIVMNEQYDLNPVFQEVRLWPQRRGELTTFSASDAIGAVQQAYGVEPRLACEHSNELSEVWMCFALDLQPIDCPGRVRPRRECEESFSMRGGSPVADACKSFFPDNYLITTV